MLTIDSAALAASQYQALAHGLGVVPPRWEAFLLCVTADAGFSAGNEVKYNSFYDSGSYHSIIQITADPANFSIMTGSSLVLIHKTTVATGLVGLDETKWKIRIRYGL
jgi:hypothetical protein